MNQFQIPFSEYHSYYKRYIDLVGEIPLIQALTNGKIEMVEFLQSIPKEKHGYRYAQGKWTPKQICLHLIDTERVFAYRALHFARSEGANLKGYDQDIFVENSNAGVRSWSGLQEEYSAVRAASVQLFKNFNEDTLKKCGTIDANNMSVRATGYIICGHEIHHQNIVRERYL